MIKSILISLLTYVMSNFLLPLEICENFASAIALVELKSTKDRDSLRKMKKNAMFAKRRGRDWFLYDP